MSLQSSLFLLLTATERKKCESNDILQHLYNVMSVECFLYDIINAVV